ncbi:hypothetical protein BXZ70DRAFT_493292 [Cristinia sonorae]|uniref:Uncharacterized protein n=1 Tax=Cristinia sonorae TaxID=1940300 RepID=A0A8K0UHY3_9AGAR|nr:hypothetical protein BXZ70DRAFT_493292 [Cristinia sonorae]
MSDPPPKKVGSLRDRIAAFENKGPAPTPGPAPVPRPKPAGASTWQPKPRTPPESPRASVDNGERKAGMSAADAKESITKGGSLKERMAALQGRGGFDLPGGASPPPIAPKPAVERPKWKPPPVVSPPPAEDDEEVGDAPKPPSISPPQEERDEAPKIAENAEAEGGTSAEEAGEEKEVDPEEEERQRRAAIAARIARLGGARVGMTAPPIFGKKPDVKRSGSVKSKEEDAPKPSPPVEATKEEAKPEPAPEVASPPIAKVEDSEPVGTPAKVEGGSQGSSTHLDAYIVLTNDCADYFGATTEPSASSTLLPDSAASSVKSPSMPVPTVPRRAAPPRKKAAKSPAPQPVLDDGITQSPASTPLLGDDVQAQDAIEAIQESKEVEQAGTRSPELKPPVEPEAPIPQPRPTDEDTLSEAKSVEPSTDDIHEVHAESVGEAASVPTELHANAEGSEEDEVVPASKHQEPTAIEVSKTEEPEVVQEEEDEAARRKRIADRLAKSGGFNPFSGLPPPMKSPSLPPATSDAEESASSPPAPPQRRSSTRQANTEPADELPSTPALPERRLSTRRESTDSNVRPPPPPVRRASTVSTDEPLRSPVIPTSPKLDAPARKGSTASVGSEGSLPAGKLSQDGNY